MNRKNPHGPLVLVTSQLCGGGAERVVATMASWWAANGRDVVVVVMRERTSQDYPMDPRVGVVELRVIGETNPWYRFSSLTGLRVLRRTVLSLAPRCVIAFQDKLNVATLLALMGTPIPVIVTEHVVPWMTPLGGFWEWMRRRTYPRASAVVAPTQAIAQWLREKKLGRVTILAYPASLSAEPNSIGLRERVILAAGRLHTVKGFDLLIRAFASIAEEMPGWRLQIAGEGPERGPLEALVDQLGISSRVTFLGRIEDLSRRMREASLFVLSSRAEAFPMVLIEAMHAGCGIVSTDCPSGPREILGENFEGLVAPDSVEALAEGIRRAVTHVSDGVRERALQERARVYRPDEVMQEWDELEATL